MADFKLHRYNVRVEPYVGGLYLGIGVTWFTEKAVTIDLLKWSISIGKIYNI